MKDRLGFKIEPNVRRALCESSPVVALESTIITHGKWKRIEKQSYVYISTEIRKKKEEIKKEEEEG